MSTGIDTIDAAPLIIRTYNDDSANNTFLLTRYDYPVSSNFVLRTSSDGSMAPSDALTQTTMGLSSMTISKHYGSTMVYDAFNASTLFLPSGIFDTITKTTMTASSITASTIYLNVLNICTINAATFSPNGVFVAYSTIGSTVQASSMVYSTLLGDSLFVNTIGVSTLFGSSMYGRSWAASTMVNDNAMFSTLIVASTAVGFLSFSTLQGSTLTISTLSGSSIYTNSLVVSTLDGGLLVMSTVGIASTLVVSSLFTNAFTASTTVGSSMNISTVITPSLLSNSLVFSTAQGSTLVVSTLTMSSLYVSLLFGSTIQGNALVFSTLLASSMNTASVVYSTAQGSTMTVSTAGVSTLTVGAVAYSTFSGSSMTVNTMEGSTVAGSTVSWNRVVFSTIQGSSATVSSATVSTLVGGVCAASSAQGSTLVVSSLVVSSMNVGGFVGSTLKSDSLFFSTMTVSTLSNGSVVYSTLQGSTTTLSTLTFSTLSVSTMSVSTLMGSTMFGNLITVSSIQFERLIFSTLNGSTLLLSTLTSCTINAQTISVSTLQGSTIGVSTLTGSTIVSGQISYSTLIGSSIVTDYISAASTFTGTGSLFISTFSFAAQQISAAFLSTLIVNSTVTVSTLNRINPTSMTASTFTLSGGLHSNTATGLLVCSTLTVNAMNVTRSIVNQPVYGNTVKIDSIAAPGWSVIRTSGIRATIDAVPSLAQTYYFGPTIPDRWIAGFTTTNTLAYSNDGFNWVGLGTTVMNMMRIAIWNGSMWVGVGDVGSISPAKSGLTANTWTQNGVTWTATASSTSNAWPIYNAFDGSLGSDYYAWAADARNYIWTGTYTGAITTTVNDIPVGLTFPSPSAGTSIAGDWLQIQSSTPLSILSYTWGCANAANQIKSYCLVGSNDGTTWYFIQYVVYSSSPCTNGYASMSTSIVASYTGTQTVSGNMTISATTTSSANSGKLYTYFRMIGIQMFSGADAMYMETGEWTITFSRSTIAYSYDGIAWTGLGTTIFTSFGLEVAWNGSMWVAVGGGLNSIAYSYDGINWTGLGKDIFSNYGHAIAWNGSMWMVPGSGSNTLAYSYDGINWVGLGATTFTTGGYGVAWNGRMWIAVGGGTNSIAYSYDGVLWVGLGVSIFTGNGVGAAWNGVMWVALADSGTNAIAYSYDGINWTGLGTSMFSGGRKLAWNGNMWLAAGTGTNTLVYSYNGINWFGLGTGISTGMGFSTSFNSTRPHRITFPASMMVATGGSGMNHIAYSTDGINWTGCGMPVTFPRYTTYCAATNGSMWIVGGQTYNSLAVSVDSEIPYIFLPFEDGLYKDVMGNANVIVSGSPSIITSSSYSALNLFNGSSTNISIQWNGSTDFSISCSFNVQNISGLQQAILMNNSSNLGFVIEPTTSYLSFYIPNYNSSNIVASTYPIVANTWYNVTGVFQAYGICSLYVNNILIGTYFNTIAANLGSFFTYYMRLYGFAGYITNVKIYQYPILNINSLIKWKGLNTSAVGNCYGIAWNKKMWVAVGSGDSIAYSYDGFTWIGLGTSVLTQGYGVAWNSSMWVTVGSGTNTIAYSYNGISWTGLGATVFTTGGKGVAWNGSMWVAVGSGTNSIAYSYDGISWTGLGTTLFSSQGNNVAWNGNRWVAVGSGTNTILYSTNGIDWTPAMASCFTVSGNGITWNGTRWVATGSGINTIGYSLDGSTWNKSQIIIPNQWGLASNTWVKNGVTWTATASSNLNDNGTYPAYGAFNNFYESLTGVYSWATPAFYSVLDGSYNGSVSTTIRAGIGAKTGEWLQIQSSVPLVLSAYKYSCGANGQIPKTYYIVGSNDNTNWYPIQSCVMSVNPLTMYFTTYATYIIVNQSGTQTIIGGQSGSGTFTTYPPYTTTAYTYFRIIGQTLWNSGTNGNMELCEWNLNFNSDNNNIVISNYTTYNSTANGGATVSTSTRNPDGYQVSLVAASSQYLKTPNFTPTINGLTFSFWYNSNGSGNWARIFDFGNGSSSDNILCSPNYDGNGGFGFACISGGLSSNYYVGSGYNDGTWRHVVWTLTYAAAGSQTSTWTIYVDGSWAAATTNYYPSTSVTRTLSYIGKSNWAGDGYYNGIIDDFRIYHSVLTSTQAYNIYSSSGSYRVGYSSIFTVAGTGIASNYGLPGTVSIQHPVIAVGQGTHTLAYSPDGIRWTGLGASIFSGAGYCVAWNGTRWIAGGLGSNTLAYSYDGLRWTGLGAAIFSSQVNGIAWNGSIWVAVGSGTNAIAFSADGVVWTGSPSANAIFTTSCNSVAWSGKQWVAVGKGTKSIAYSTDGFVWTAITGIIFSSQGNCVCWTDSRWVAVGSGTNAIAYSSNGSSWTGLGTTIFTSGNSVCWNGMRCVAVGTGNNTIALSTSITLWTGYGKTVFPVAGYGVCWAGTQFVAVGDTIVYSKNGYKWISASNNVFTQGNGVAGNPRIGAVVCDSQVALSDSTTLDVVSDTYYNTGYTNFSAAIQAQTYTVDPTSIATVVKTLPGAPTNVVGATYPAGAVIGIRVSFTYPSNTGGGVEAYYASAIDTAGLQPTVTVSSVTQPISLTTGLIPGTTYRFEVYSSNSAGQSIATTGGSNVLFQIPPSAPQNYVVALDPPTNPTSIVVSFTAPSNLGGGITNYVVTPTLGSAQTGLALSYTFTGFTAGSLYTFSTAGYNTGGTGVAAITSITYYTKPDAPTVTGITLDPAGAPTGVNVAFTSGGNGGGTLTYVATAYDSNSAVVSSASGSSSPLKITGLTPGSSYTYRVVASNASVSSTASAAFGPTLYLVQPAAPNVQSVALDSLSTPTGINVAFTTNGYNGGGTLSYVATAYSGSTVISSSAPSSTSPITVTGLTPGTPYTFKVIASNAAVSSVASASSSSLTYYTKSGPPTAIGAALHPTDVPTGVNVSFTAPSNLGGGDLTYVATAYLSGVATAFTASGSSSPLKITGLTAGTPYTFSVIASHVSVSSDASTAVSLTYYTKPSPPQNLTVSAVFISNQWRNTFTWAAPASPGGTITGYTLMTDSSFDVYTYASNVFSVDIYTSTRQGFYISATNNGGFMSEYAYKQRA